MSDQLPTSTLADATPPASPAPAAPVAVPATPAAASPSVPDTTAQLRQALVRAQVASVLGPVAAPWVMEAALNAASPDLLDDFSGLTPKSKERLTAFKSQNAFAFAQPQAAQPTQAAQPAAGAPVTSTPPAPAEPLPATPSSATGATAGLSTDQLRRLGQIHVNPADITKHNDWPRVKAFWGVA